MGLPHYNMTAPATATRGAAARRIGYNAVMALNVLFLGDIVGQPGRRVVHQQLPALRERTGADRVIANAENAAAGSGCTAAMFDKLLTYGIDGITFGDHVFRQSDLLPVLDREAHTCRPLNLPESAPGNRYLELTAPDGRPIIVATVLGRLFMQGVQADDPFAAADMLLHELPREAIVIIEVHAEATSEKVAIGHHLAGRVAAVVGTHTHIPTADAKILHGGTAYITDIGMSGPYDSVLGRRKDRVLQFMTTGVPARFDVAEEDVRLCGAHLTFDDAGRAIACQRIEAEADMTHPPFDG